MQPFFIRRDIKLWFLHGLLLSSVWCSTFGTFGALIGPRNPGSVVGLPTVSGSGGSFAPVFSADGQHIVFISHANNLVTNDDNALLLDVFVRDLVAATTRLVSVQPSGRGGGNGNSIEPSVSSNGLFVAFQSEASNLVGNDGNGTRDVFLRDTIGGTTALVSVNSAGTGSGNGPSSNPQASADGRFVLFESLASDLVANDTNGLSDVFVRDLLLGTTTLVSVNSDGTGSAGGKSDSASMTPDGRWVAFVSTATDLVPGAVNALGEIYVRDLQSATTSWASGGAAGFVGGPIRSYNPALSSDGRFVVFKTKNVTNSSAILLRYDAQASLTALIDSKVHDLDWPVVTPDGRFIAYEATSSGTTNQAIYRWDAQDGTNHLVSVNTVGLVAISGTARNPVMSADGNRIAFLSTSDSLTTNASQGRSQVFVRDVAAGSTKLGSGNSSGTASEEGGGIFPAISPDGTKVAFDSKDGNLVAGDFNQMSDVFVYSLDTGLTELASRRAASLPSFTGPGTSFVTATSLSSNGQRIAFSVYDGLWTVGDTNGANDLIVRDRLALTNIFASPGSNGLPVVGASSAQGMLSGDGRWLGLLQPSLTLTPSTFLRNLETGQLYRLGANNVSFQCSSVPHPAVSISDDGRFVAFQTSDSLVANDANSGNRDIYVRATALNTNILVSALTPFSGTEGFESRVPLISASGRWIAFQSLARGLTPNSIVSSFFPLYAHDTIN